MSEKAHNTLILAQSELPYELGQQRTMKKEDEDTDEVAIFRGADQVCIYETTDGLVARRIDRTDCS